VVQGQVPMDQVVDAIKDHELALLTSLVRCFDSSGPPGVLGSPRSSGTRRFWSLEQAHGADACLHGALRGAGGGLLGRGAWGGAGRAECRRGPLDAAHRPLRTGWWVFFRPRASVACVAV
jgi:hypothetical protein